MSRAIQKHKVMDGALRRSLGESHPGDHFTFIYEDTQELIAFLLPYFRTGLARGQRCIYVFGELNPTHVTEALIAGGIDNKRGIERGAFAVLSAREYYALPFDALRVLDLMERRVAEARSRGFTGLRIAGDMTWTLKEGVGDNALVEYESLLDEAAGSAPVTAACLYRRDRFPPALLQRLIGAHARVVASDGVYLGLSALFQNLARSDLQSLLRSARERRKRKGEFYFHQGDQATEIFVLTNGKVKLVRTEPDGRSLIFRIIAPTEPFGDRATLGGAARLSSAQALEDSRALVWDTPTILQAMLSHPAVSLNAVRLMEERVEDERDRLQDLATSGVERRLARLLLRLVQSMGHRTPNGVAIEVPLSGHDLAELTFATPYTVSRILADWRRRRTANVGRKRILIQNQQRMAALAGLSAGLFAAEAIPPRSTTNSKPSIDGSRLTRPRYRREARPGPAVARTARSRLRAAARA